LTRERSADSLAGRLGDIGMEWTWINKLRVAGVAALGIVLIGIQAWPLASPRDPLTPVRAWSITPSGTITLVVLAFAVGLAGYFIAWPHGREIAILGVPFALAVWAGRSGPMRALTQALPTAAEREALLRSLRFEPAYWLLITAAGFAGVLAAQYLRPGGRPLPTVAQIKARLTPANYVNAGIALVVAGLVAVFFIGVFAQDLSTSYRLAATQPAVGQIIFAVAAAFAVAAFVVKRFLSLSYVWPTIATVLVLPLADLVYGNAATVTRFAQTEPATSYPHAAFAIVPVQLVALAALGSVIGYWLAACYTYWRQHESVQ
jgi:hypothetical protein